MLVSAERMIHIQILCSIHLLFLLTVVNFLLWMAEAKCRMMMIVGFYEALSAFLKSTCQFCNGRFVAPIRALGGIGQFNAETISIHYFWWWFLLLSTFVTNIFIDEGIEEKDWKKGYYWVENTFASNIVKNAIGEVLDKWKMVEMKVKMVLK